MRHVSADDNDLLDLVDENDKVIGTIYQADSQKLLDTKAGYIRGAVAFIQNDQGELWTPTRSASKRVAPNGMDFGVGEHVQKGETYLQAIIRGFKEELFMDLHPRDLQELGRLGLIPHRPYFFTGVFLYKANEVSGYNHADYIGCEWLTPDEIIERIDAGLPSKNALKLAIQTYLLKK